MQEHYRVTSSIVAEDKLSSSKAHVKNNRYLNCGEIDSPQEEIFL